MNIPKPLALLFIALATLLAPLKTEAKTGSRRKPHPSHRTTSPTERKLTAYIAEIRSALDPRVQNALARIPTFHRNLLALKYYLIRRDEVDEKWAWSAKEVREFKKTLEYQETISHVQMVRDTFAALNPGYRLHTQIVARDLSAQLLNWNRTKSVDIAGRALLDSCLALMADSTAGYTDSPNEETIECFRMLLTNYEPPLVPTVAVPGMSDHGRLRAFDFRVTRGRRLIAGTTSAEIQKRWEESGWTERLKEAIGRASNRFDGPLDSPYEPWHYDYMPLIVADDGPSRSTGD